MTLRFAGARFFRKPISEFYRSQPAIALQIQLRADRKTIRREKFATLDALTTGRVARDAYAEMLRFFATARETDLKFELVAAAKTLRGAIECDESRHLGRQTLFEIGGLERGTLDVDRAVAGGAGETDRRQRTRCAIRADRGENTDAHLAARRRLDVALDQIRLRASIVREDAK